MSINDQAHRLAQGPLESMAIDVAHNVGVVKLRDGRSLRTPLNFHEPDDRLAITHMLYTFADRALQVTTLTGESAVIDIALPGEKARESGRRVVYLDQGHWSAVARHLHGPTSLAANEAAAADKLIEWAVNGHIILPLSSGHFIETTPLFGPKRHSLALTMLKLSRGWRMRSPVLVRRDEIVAVLETDRRQAQARPDVFTLDPDGLFIDSSAPPVPADLPGYLGWLFQRLTSVSANFAVLIENQRTQPEKTSAWSDRLAAIGLNPEFMALSTKRRRTAALVNALSDALAEPSVLAYLRHLGLPGEEVATSLFNGLRKQRETMPFLRLYGDALGVRLLNPTTKWVPNDLIDMLYLGCAAAYADAVAAERTASVYLTSALRDRQDPCPVVPTLGELVAILESMGLP